MRNGARPPQANKKPPAEVQLVATEESTAGGARLDKGKKKRTCMGLWDNPLGALILLPVAIVLNSQFVFTLVMAVVTCWNLFWTWRAFGLTLASIYFFCPMWLRVGAAYAFHKWAGIPESHPDMVALKGRLDDGMLIFWDPDELYYDVYTPDDLDQNPALGPSAAAGTVTQSETEKGLIESAKEEAAQYIAKMKQEMEEEQAIAELQKRRADVEDRNSYSMHTGFVEMYRANVLEPKSKQRHFSRAKPKVAESADEVFWSECLDEGVGSALN